MTTPPPLITGKKKGGGLVHGFMFPSNGQRYRGKYSWKVPRPHFQYFSRLKKRTESYLKWMRQYQVWKRPAVWKEEHEDITEENDQTLSLPLRPKGLPRAAAHQQSVHFPGLL